MPIKAIFLSGQTKITVNGLHQWDYGRQLEIHAPDLPASIEVHFACMGMDSAVVRTCSVINGTAKATIPDRCLSQASPVYAWIYEINGNTGATTKTIILPIIHRARPQISEDIPTEYSDKYTEALTAMNEHIGALTSGELYVAEAKHSAKADSATKSDRATNADHATKADTSVKADSATVAAAAFTIGKYLHNVHLTGKVNNRPSDINFQFVCENNTPFTNTSSLMTAIQSAGFDYTHSLPASGFLYWNSGSEKLMVDGYVIVHSIRPSGDYLLFLGFDCTNQDISNMGGPKISAYTILSDVVTTL